MKPIVLWVVGEPGAGKTSMVRHLMEPSAIVRMGKIKWTVGPTVCAAGTYTGETFDGGDTVPYDGAKMCLLYWLGSLRDKRLTILDGDRFSNDAVRKTLDLHDVELRVVHLVTVQAKVRRYNRGSKQSEAWVKGRTTKAARFAGLFPPERRLVLDSSLLPPHHLAATVSAWLTQ